MIFKVCLGALIAAFVAVIAKELGWRGSGVLSVGCGALILLSAIEGIGELGSEIGVLSKVGELSELGEAALKIIGIGYIFGICADVCTDLGERSLASAVNFAGRIEILTVVLPYFKKILELGLELL